MLRKVMLLLLANAGKKKRDNVLNTNRRPLSKTVRFNVLKVFTKENKKSGKQFQAY